MAARVRYETRDYPTYPQAFPGGTTADGAPKTGVVAVGSPAPAYETRALGGATVTVTVNMQITVTATPQTINQGQSSQLNVVVAGGLGPYTYQWAAADGASLESWT